jgi:hypothetical protein
MNHRLILALAFLYCAPLFADNAVINIQTPAKTGGMNEQDPEKPFTDTFAFSYGLINPAGTFVVTRTETFTVTLQPADYATAAKKSAAIVKAINAAPPANLTVKDNVGSFTVSTTNNFIFQKIAFTQSGLTPMGNKVSPGEVNKLNPGKGLDNTGFALSLNLQQPGGPSQNHYAALIIIDGVGIFSVPDTFEMSSSQVLAILASQINVAATSAQASSDGVNLSITGITASNAFTVEFDDPSFQYTQSVVDVPAVVGVGVGVSAGENNQRF